MRIALEEAKKGMFRLSSHRDFIASSPHRCIDHYLIDPTMRQDGPEDTGEMDG